MQNQKEKVIRKYTQSVFEDIAGNPDFFQK